MNGFAVENFGCRASTADGDAIAEVLCASGEPAAEDASTAAVVVVNTCAVTAAAEREARRAIRRVHRTNPGARVVVTGCYAERAPEELRGLPGVVAVLGNHAKARVPAAALAALGLRHGRQEPTGGARLLPVSAIAPAARTGWPSVQQRLGNEQPGYEQLGNVGAAPWEETLPLVTGAGLRTRPVLKVQEGCSNRCSFCVIPQTRGRSRSVELATAVEAARAFAARGGQELVLSGIHLGRWGAELPGRQTLATLVRALLEETALPRLRLSSIEPMDWSPELLRLVARYTRGLHPRLAPHAHVPLQSGADATLRAMHRRYRPWHYAEKLVALRAAMPEGSLGADVMVGFPGETEALHGESFRFVEEVPLTYLHLFPFSPRPGTAAEPMHRSDPVAPAAVRARMERFQVLHAEKRLRFARGFAGAALSAVTLADDTALTANFLRVELPPGGAANRLLRVRIASIEEEESRGRVALRIAGAVVA